MAKQQVRRMSMVQAAEVVLHRSSKPLHSKEIIHIAVAEGLIEPPVGKSPDRSLQAVIWRDIHEGRKGISPFIMVGGDCKSDRRYWLKSKLKREPRS